jgi:hypothetical protein
LKGLGKEMSKHLYEISWMIMTDVCHFLKARLKVFENEDEAVSYGLSEEISLNDGQLPVEKALDGFCYKFFDVRRIDTIDGFPITLVSRGEV